MMSTWEGWREKNYLVKKVKLDHAQYLCLLTTNTFTVYKYCGLDGCSDTYLLLTNNFPPPALIFVT